ncbi:transglycosylase family protein [Streptomyces qinzhouensis]|uniref:LysM peptidoglycan-binding domain-containing protein n=1 Tax=Streptomyces qinzhouensis TaxID=2599401 RepID=A0A5B8J710_9ACTN|nr:transglycosylase family protein [Streptomyces qinzhouensis]QDY77137.1 LysM peptidoglycan-binding domain-containing protein [Streptomyces qinzhouensis]
MLSGNGRHRRPRQAPALVVAAGVTGSAIAIPLLGATSASAADSAAWDRVAECESAGQWTVNNGNGYYGGLQLSEETWTAYGGREYADRPDLASRSQQIAVAEKVLAAEGPKAWPSCGTASGLGTAAGAADPGGADPVPSGPAAGRSADPAKGAGPAEPRKAGEKAPDAAAPPAGAAGKKESPGKPADGVGKHRGAPAAEETAPGTPSGTADTGTGAPKDPGTPPVDAADPSRASGPDRTSRSDTATRSDALNQGDQGGTGTPVKDGTTDGTGEAGQSSGTYTVRSGDNLWSIAEEKKVPGGWPALYEANQKVVGADPDHILPGQSLDLQAK